MAADGHARFAWYADDYDPGLASIRYRLLQPLAALRDLGVPIARLDPARDPASYAAIILSKAQGRAAVAIAERARAAGRAVVYDVCDNLWAAHAAGHLSAARLDRVGRLLSLATHVSFATPALADLVARQVGVLTERRYVIPDTLDVEPDVAAPPPSALARIELALLRRHLARHPAALHCIWFGKSLGRLSGYDHVDLAVAHLRRFAARHPVTLTIVSNDRLGFWRARRRWRLPVRYVGWSLATRHRVMALHRVAVIPVATNDYTAGKTINRPATALLAGLGVVADGIASYEPLRPYVALDDWAAGLERYRVWSPETQATLAAGRRMLIDHFAPEAVARQWAALLNDVDAAAPASYVPW